MEKTQEFEYFAFISYKREDEKWAKWLQHKLEYYKMPTSAREYNPHLPPRIRPVCKDTTDLEPGILAKRIKDALSKSSFLIVICSPCSAQSAWVGKEVQEFIDQGRADHIIPFIIKGTPHSVNPTEECFPEVLRNLSGEQELLGANIFEMGRDAAAIKVIACMFDLRFDTLWQRYKKEQFRIYILKIIVLLVFLSLLIYGLYSLKARFNEKIITFCKECMMGKEGCFDVQSQLLKYDKKTYFLYSKTKKILSKTIRSIDYYYSINMFPLIYKTPLINNFKYGKSISFNKNEDEILIGPEGCIYKLKSREQRKLPHFTIDAKFSFDDKYIIQNSENIIIYEMNDFNQKYTLFESHSIETNPQEYSFISSKEKKLIQYNLKSKKITFTKEFTSDILSISYNSTGKYIIISDVDGNIYVLDNQDGELIRTKKSIPIVSIQPDIDETQVLIAEFENDSTSYKKVSLFDENSETLLYKLPSTTYTKSKISATQGPYIVFSTGRYVAMFNRHTSQLLGKPWDVYSTHHAEVEAICQSPQGDKLAMIINQQLNVFKLKTATEAFMKPLYKFGFKNSDLLSLARLASNDSTLLLSVMKNKDLSITGFYNLYSSRLLSDTFVTTYPISYGEILPHYNRALLSLDEEHCWGIIDFNSSKILKKIDPEKFDNFSSAKITENEKYILTQNIHDFESLLSSALWDINNYNLIKETDITENLLQDGKHYYKKLEEVFMDIETDKEDMKLNNIYFNGEEAIFDNNKSAYISGTTLYIYNFFNKVLITFDLKDFLKGDWRDYHIISYKYGFVVLFNRYHLLIFEEETQTIVFDIISNQIQITTNAHFLSNSQKLMVGTTLGVYVIDFSNTNKLKEKWKMILK